MPSYPPPGAIAATNPPIFSWPSDSLGPYWVEIVDSAGNIVSLKTRANWLTPSHRLHAGEYRWRHTPLSRAQKNNGDWNSFSIPQDSIGLPLPDVDVLLLQVKKKNHPRSIDPATLRMKAITDPGFSQLLPKIKAWRDEILPIEPELRPDQFPQGKARNAQVMAIQEFVFGEENKILPAALAWLATGDSHARDEAKRRALNLSNWDSKGVTSFGSHDQVGRSIVWTLALAYDWLYPEFSEADRARLVVVIGDRLGDILGKGPYGLDDGRRLNANPYDSHGAVALARVSVICAVMAGVAPQFDACFQNVAPRYLMWPVPWGRDDGGYANGTNYAQWDVAYTHLIVWDLLRESIGIDLARTPWAQGYGKFIAYFLPPGTPTGMFGDGAEKNWRGVWATQARAYAARVPSPLADWYARSQVDAVENNLQILLAPPRDWSAVSKEIPADIPNALHLPSIGWVAMHSDLADRGRTSVYFKSSSYGSFSHSHADQNGFVINAGGQPLVIDSGYYDYYNSPHWKDWYKQTRAHNAITFDGGRGQSHDTMAAKGKITQFETTPALDWVTGDATQAYGGALTRAVRSMVYVRPGTLLVFDSLSSNVPRTWEWNIHAMKSMKVTGKRSIEIQQGGERLCVEVLHGPDMEFSQTDQFTAAPDADQRKQWHGAFKSVEKSKALRMLTMLSVGCEAPAIEVSDVDGNLLGTLAGYRFAFGDAGVERVQ